VRSLPHCVIPFRSLAGILIARVKITPIKDGASDETAPLVEIDESDAKEYGETAIQLRESERYEYELISENGEDIRLRCSLASRRKSLEANARPDAGRIETRTFCGTLLLEVVQGPVDNDKPSIASALIDVRSLKLDYRTEYRGMLRRLADEMAALVVDSRSSGKAPFHSSFEERVDAGWLQIQLELLRETLDSSDFAAAVQRILNYPHERLSTVIDSVSTDRNIRWTPNAVRQFVGGNPRRALPSAHPLRSTTGLSTIAERVSVPRRSRDLDTAENRFVKFALEEFRSFLTHAHAIFEKSKGWEASAALARRLSGKVEEWLGRSLFQEIGHMRFAPLGSPVLQRKAGYREILRWWLRFRTAAELSWEGGQDLFKAGQRDVASLYEYWLFFELLDWFYRKCRRGDRPSIEELVDGLDTNSPNLRLRKRIELGPFLGMVVGTGRRLNARFSYNKRFKLTKDRTVGGSWTRDMHPDYTLTFWPAGVSEERAERDEMLVHLHFDAKYRVDNIEGLFGLDDSDDVDEETDGNYKRQDLLKMHAYRDAIKRSQGAYVLYPGRALSPTRFEGFHEILPGLGAFAVSPDDSGRAQGMSALSDFLDESLFQLCNRAAAQERSNYHLRDAYRVKGPSRSNGLFAWPEVDPFDTGLRALPPAEHLIMVAWRYDVAQLEWAKTNCVAIISLGSPAASWRFSSEFASIRHLLLHSIDPMAPKGVWQVAAPGYRVLAESDLVSLGYPFKASGCAYAAFDVRSLQEWPEVDWDAKRLLRQIREFESTVGHKVARNVGRRSLFPRIVPLALIPLIMES
jgi:predicted component of viral defense system (DUF524 family)